MGEPYAIGAVGSGDNKRRLAGGEDYGLPCPVTQNDNGFVIFGENNRLTPEKVDRMYRKSGGLFTVSGNNQTASHEY